MSDDLIESLEVTIEELEKSIFDLKQEIDKLPDKSQQWDLKNVIMFVSGSLDSFVSWIIEIKKFKIDEYSLTYQTVEAVLSGIGLGLSNLKIAVERIKQEVENNS